MARKHGSPSVVKWVPAWISKPPTKSSPHCAARCRRPEISAWVGLRVTGSGKPPAITRAARGRAAAGSGDAASAGLRRPASQLDSKRPGLRFRSTESLSARSKRPIAGYATVQLLGRQPSNYWFQDAVVTTGNILVLSEVSASNNSAGTIQLDWSCWLRLPPGQGWPGFDALRCRSGRAGWPELDTRFR